MKKIAIPGILILVVVVAFSFFSALDHGEKSPIFVEGKVSVAPSLRADLNGITTMFIVIYDLDSPRPMPYGAVREKIMTDDLAAGASLNFFVTKEKIQTMNPNAPYPRRMSVKVRLDRDGFGGRDQPGDLTGVESEVAFGTTGLLIEISEKAG